MSVKTDENCGCGCSEPKPETAKPAPATGMRELNGVKMADEDSLCCPPPSAEAASCCGPAPNGGDPMERAGIKVWPFVAGWRETPAGLVPVVSPEITQFDIFGRWAMRWGIGRSHYRIAPGLHACGQPDENSPVLVTCNYKLTFDHLRTAWAGQSYWVLVLETQGVNVWCAAGKGTFGTEELVARLKVSGVEKVVNHRELILPQLGAPGVAAHKVVKQTGFKVFYGPVRAEDVPRYIADGKKASRQMREVTFTMWERFILAPVEIVMMSKFAGWVALVSVISSGIGPSIWSPVDALTRGLLLFLACVMGLLGGAVVMPVLLPWLPGRLFALRGALSGLGTGLLALAFFGGSLGWMETIGFLGASIAVGSYTGMNFTGATTFTSPSGVEKEMRKAVPWQVGGAAAALVAWIVGAFVG